MPVRYDLLDRWVSEWATVQERRARRRLRHEIRVVLQRAVPSDFAMTPARPRRSGIWLA
ncbi:hypothetical protein [Actinomadura macra]|uniref:hypothetical protein n=1 Tax=Actinomadura macra TaxID=46164 RepID=UPI000B224616|nr:hypothetical protein [Actinomadura macra]